MTDTQLDRVPIRYSIGSIVDLVGEGRGKLSTVVNDKLIKNLQLGLIDYCQWLSLKNKRYGPC
jgi:hypothetical protein